METPPGDVTRLLAAWTRGDAAAFDRRLPPAEAEVRRLAAACIRRERVGLALQPTALAALRRLRELRGKRR